MKKIELSTAFGRMGSPDAEKVVDDLITEALQADRMGQVLHQIDGGDINALHLGDGNERRFRVVIDESSSLKEVGRIFNGMSDKQRLFWNLNSVYGKYGRHRDPTNEQLAAYSHMFTDHVLKDIDITHHLRMLAELERKPVNKLPNFKRLTLAVAFAFPIYHTERYL